MNRRLTRRPCVGATTTAETVYFFDFFLSAAFAAFAKAFAASFSFFAASFSFLRIAFALSSCSSTSYISSSADGDSSSKANVVRVAGDGSGTLKFLGKTPGNQLCVAGAISDRNTYYFLISDLGSGTEVGKMYYIENVDDEPGSPGTNVPITSFCWLA